MSDTFVISKASFIKLVDLLISSSSGDKSTQRKLSVSEPLLSESLLGIDLPMNITQAYGAVLDAREIVDQTINQNQLAEAMLGSEQSEQIRSLTINRIKSFVDSYCGTVPPELKFKIPGPKFVNIQKIKPIDLIIAGIEIKKGADLDISSSLQADFNGAGDQLIEVGLQRL